MFFQPLRQHIATPEQFNIEYEDVYFSGKTGPELHGWWFPAKQSAKANILFLHGNAENISTHSGLVYWLTQYQYNVFIFDYRGYGKSTGEAELEGVLDDINSARAYVAERIMAQGEQSRKFYILGHSLGASLGVYNLAQDASGIDAVVLVSPFSDYKKVAQEMMSKTWLTWAFQWIAPLTVNADYNPVDYVAKLPVVPKLFIYSENDQVIDPYHVKRLYKNASKNKYLEKIIGHHNNVFAYKENQQLLLKYLDEWSDVKSLEQ